MKFFFSGWYIYKKISKWAQKRIIDTVKIKTAKILRAKIYQITVIDFTNIHHENISYLVVEAL